MAYVDGLFLRLPTVNPETHTELPVTQIKSDITEGGEITFVLSTGFKRHLHTNGWVIALQDDPTKVERRVHGLFEIGGIHACDPLDGSIAIGREPEFLRQHFHSFWPEGVEKPELCEVDIRQAVTLRIRIGGNALEVHHAHFNVELYSRAKGFAFVAGVLAGIKSEGILEVTFKPEVSSPIVHGTVVFVIAH